MKQFTLKTRRSLAVVVAAMLAATAALADKPSRNDHGKAGKYEQQQQGKANKHEQRQQQDHDRDDRSFSQRGSDGFREQRYFGDRHRTVIRHYYAEQFRRGRCPPGLAKKNNGCLPPGQAKKWVLGRQLPRNVIYYDLPPTVLMQLGPPPPRHRYVRVANDILLITTGTGMVVDAITDLSGG